MSNQRDHERSAPSPTHPTSEGASRAGAGPTLARTTAGMAPVQRAAAPGRPGALPFMDVMLASDAAPAVQRKEKAGVNVAEGSMFDRMRDRAVEDGGADAAVYFPEATRFEQVRMLEAAADDDAAATLVESAARGDVAALLPRLSAKARHRLLRGRPEIAAAMSKAELIELAEHPGAPLKEIARQMSAPTLDQVMAYVDGGARARLLAGVGAGGAERAMSNLSDAEAAEALVLLNERHHGAATLVAFELSEALLQRLLAADHDGMRSWLSRHRPDVVERFDRQPQS